MGLTYYELLGVSKTATNEDIEGAYRSASKAYHPDAHGPVANSALFREATEARDTLINPIERRRYDGYLAQRPSSNPESNHSEHPPRQYTTGSNPYRASSSPEPPGVRPRMRRSFALLVLAGTMYVASRGIIQFGNQDHLSFISFFGHQLMAWSAIPMIAFFIVPKDRLKRLISLVSKFVSKCFAPRTAKSTRG
jgi:curved DNA-binding protein CbpA